MSIDAIVRARVRRRTAHDEPPAEERWDSATAESYEKARDEIRRRLPDGDFVVAWHVDR